MCQALNYVSHWSLGEESDNLVWGPKEHFFSMSHVQPRNDCLWMPRGRVCSIAIGSQSGGNQGCKILGRDRWETSWGEVEVLLIGWALWVLEPACRRRRRQNPEGPGNSAMSPAVRTRRSNPKDRILHQYLSNNECLQLLAEDNYK